jgi:DNA-binding transcriptional MocR family regulator
LRSRGTFGNSIRNIYSFMSGIYLRGAQIMDEINLSEYGRASVIPAPINRMMDSFAADFREDSDINLGVGYVNENTIPRTLIEEALHEVILHPRKYRAALNYGGPKGSGNLIASIRDFLVKNEIGGLTKPVLDRNEIIIAPCGATSILEGIAHILPRGLVITSDPVYYIYSNFLERMGFEILAVPEDAQGINTDLLMEKLSQLGSKKRNISFLYVVTVNNPSGVILARSRQKNLVQIAGGLTEELGRKTPLFLDKAYENLIHDPLVAEPVSALLYDRYQVVYEIYTLSKIIAPALRIGYLVGPPAPFMQAMIQKTSDVGFSAPLILQEIAGYILDHHAVEQIDSVNRGYRQKAIQIKKWIDELIGEYVAELRGGQGGFYYYLTLEGIETHEESAFFKFLTRTTGQVGIDGPAEDKKPRVIYIPGQHCVHSRGSLTEISKRQLRLSYGFEELDNIHRSLRLIREAISYVRSM